MGTEVGNDLKCSGLRSLWECLPQSTALGISSLFWRGNGKDSDSNLHSGGKEELDRQTLELGFSALSSRTFGGIHDWTLGLRTLRKYNVTVSEYAARPPGEKFHKVTGISRGSLRQEGSESRE